MPEPRPGSVQVRIEASSLMSYLKDYIKGKLSMYNPPKEAFITGGNGVGIVHAIDRDVWHLKLDQRVMLSSHFTAAENIEDPVQILIGVTALSHDAEKVQADWRNRTLVEYTLMSGTAVTPVEGLSQIDSAHLAVLMRFIVPFGGLLRERLAVGETLVVTGATGAYGGAAVLLAIAMGAGRVIAVGRNAVALEVVVLAGGARVVPVVFTGNIQIDEVIYLQPPTVAHKWHLTW